MSKLGLVLVIIATLLGVTLYGGFVLSFLWDWFVVPLGVRSVGIAQAIGISLIASNFTYHLAKDKDQDNPFEALLSVLIAETMFLALGFILHLFVEQTK